MILRNIGGTLASILVALGLLFVVSEIALRIYMHYAIFYDVEMARYANEFKLTASDPRIGHVHKPNSEGRLMGVTVRINADGLRDADYPVPRGDGYRIIFLGDSLTFGWGVRKGETLESLIEAKCRRREPTAEILNFGTGNYNTEQEVRLFIEKGMKYQPDEVVVFYFINDAEPTAARSPWAFLGHSRMITFIWSRAKAVLSRIRPAASFREYYADLYKAGQPGWEAMKSAFRKIKDICDAEGIALRAVLLPELHNPANYPFTEEHRKVSGFLGELGIPFLDLAPYFASESDPLSLWVALDDAHPNAPAHRKIAEYAFEFVSAGIR